MIAPGNGNRRPGTAAAVFHEPGALLAGIATHNRVAASRQQLTAHARKPDRPSRRRETYNHTPIRLMLRDYSKHYPT